MVKRRDKAKINTAPWNILRMRCSVFTCEDKRKVEPVNQNQSRFQKKMFKNLVFKFDLYEARRSSTEQQTLWSFAVFPPLLLGFFVTIFKIIDLLKYCHKVQLQGKTSRIGYFLKVVFVCRIPFPHLSHKKFFWDPE